MQFRNDINGLRAIAVLAVVLFHYDPSWLPGGFIGVDVFFVISGFLMTGIIFRGIEQGNFSISKFYMARAYRIVPALTVLCLFLFIFGWLFLIPLDYKILSQHAASSVGFVSNIVYLNESGYFDAESHEKWLLHTWSLSVEWQFYIIYPLILIAMRQFMSIEAMKTGVLIGAGLGFTLCIIVTNRWPDVAFYSMPTRIWEMLVGGIAYLYPFTVRQTTKKFLEFAGIVLILGSYCFVSAETLWPGYIALLPVLGAFLVIQAQTDRSVITNNVVFQKIGSWSYSIYLWHWVIVVVNIKFSLGLSFFVYSLITLALGYISYLYFEKCKSVTLILLAAGVLILSWVIYASNGGSARVEQKFQLDKMTFHKRYWGGFGYASNELIYFNSAKNDYDLFFVGDSFGQQYARALDQSGVKAAALFDQGCLILPNYTRSSGKHDDVICTSEYEKVRSALKNNLKPVVMASSWNTYNGLLMKRNGKKVRKLEAEEYYDLLLSELEVFFYQNDFARKYFLIGIPQQAKINAFECLSRTQLLGYRLIDKCNETQDRQSIPVNEILRKFSKRHPNVYFIDPNDTLCANGKCLIIKDGQPIHSDQGHVSIFGAPIVVNGVLRHVINLSRQL